MVVMGVPVAQPRQIQCHAQLGQVEEAAVIIPASNRKPQKPWLFHGSHPHGLVKGGVAIFCLEILQGLLRLVDLFRGIL